MSRERIQPMLPTESPHVEIHQVFQTEGITVVHENMPKIGFFPVDQDGLFRTGDACISIQGPIVSNMDVWAGSLRSLTKEKQGLVSADQVIFAYLDQTRLVAGIVDGRFSLIEDEDWYSLKSIFPQRELEEYQRLTGIDLSKMKVSSDAWPSIMFTKLFPLSSEWQVLKNSPETTAKDVMLAADRYLEINLPQVIKRKYPQYLWPGLVGSIALVDFAKDDISTAHIGDTTVGREFWPEYLLGEPNARGLIENELFSYDQNQWFQLALAYFRNEQKLGKIRRFKDKDLLKAMYQAKTNVLNGCGVANGGLLADLVYPKHCRLGNTVSLLFHTDGSMCGDLLAFRNMAYTAGYAGDIKALYHLRNLAQKGIEFVKRGDDGAFLVVNLAKSPQFGISGREQWESFLFVRCLDSWRCTEITGFELLAYSYHANQIELNLATRVGNFSDIDNPI